MDRRTVLLGLASAASLPLAATAAQDRAAGQPPEAARGSAPPRMHRPNILVLCMDQWQTHMRIPDAVPVPAMRRLEAQGVSFDRQYCTVPMCTPSRATMWTGLHAKTIGLWDNTNFAWTGQLRPETPTIGHLLREQGYYTAFKGKWHLSKVPHREDGLEPHGFADYQQWGDMFGMPLQGAQLDDNAAFEAVEWLEHKAPTLNQPWMLVCSLINPHDVMFLRADPAQIPNPHGITADIQTTVQTLNWFQQDWGVAIPANFADDYARQPFGVRAYKQYVDENFGRIPDDHRESWLRHRNYLVNALRLADAQFAKVLGAVDKMDLWRDTVVILTEDHGEMNGAHRLTQKGGTPFEEASVVNLTVCAPGGPRGQRTAALGSHLDLAPTMLGFAGLDEDGIKARYPHLRGRSLMGPILDPDQDGPRGSTKAPGDGVLVCWDALHALDTDWSMTGALKAGGNKGETCGTPEHCQSQLLGIGQKFGAPDFGKRTFFRVVCDGRHKLVRWFGADHYGNPATLEALRAGSDVALYDLVADPGELQNLAHPDHPGYDPATVERMLGKLHALVAAEIGEDTAPFDLDLFGTRKILYRG